MYRSSCLNISCHSLCIHLPLTMYSPVTPGNDNTVGGGLVYPIADLGDLSGMAPPESSREPVAMIDGRPFNGAKAYKDSKVNRVYIEFGVYIYIYIYIYIGGLLFTTIGIGANFLTDCRRRSCCPWCCSQYIARVFNDSHHMPVTHYYFIVIHHVFVSMHMHI